MSFPLPIHHTQIRRINGTSRVETKNMFINYDSSEVCWVCEGWQENVFLLQKESEAGKIYLHLDFLNYRAIRMEEKNGVFECRRMVPLGEFRYFFSRESDGEAIVSHHEPRVPENKTIRVVYPSSQKDLHVGEINYKVQEFKTELVKDEYERNITCTYKETIMS